MRGRDASGDRAERSNARARKRGRWLRTAGNVAARLSLVLVCGGLRSRGRRHRSALGARVSRLVARARAAHAHGRPGSRWERARACLLAECAMIRPAVSRERPGDGRLAIVAVTRS